MLTVLELALVPHAWVLACVQIAAERSGVVPATECLGYENCDNDDDRGLESSLPGLE